VPNPVRLAETAEERFCQGIHAAERFFMGQAEVQKALEKLARELDPFVREKYLELWGAVDARRGR
jgi:hypothetical protein